MMTEAFLEEDTLMRVLVIGLTRELPLSPADALDIADKLVARAANAHMEGNTVKPSLISLSQEPPMHTQKVTLSNHR